MPFDLLEARITNMKQKLYHDCLPHALDTLACTEDIVVKVHSGMQVGRA